MADKKQKVILQVSQGDYNIDDIAQLAVKDYKKNNKAALKDINVYVKPEDGKAYYTANNDTVKGSIDI